MARSINRLSAAFVSKVTKPGTHSDGAGLILRVAPGGSKQWQLRYRWGGKERYMGLGGVHTVSLANARDAARQARQLLLEGIDPIGNRQKARQASLSGQIHAITFRDACEQYIAAHETSWRNPKHRKQWWSTLERYAWPLIGGLPVRDIDTAAVHRVLEPIWLVKTETASRLRGRIENILDWATVREYRDGENPARWRGHLQSLLPARSKVQRVQHHVALPYVQIGQFITELRERGGAAARALEFTILTAARTGETLGAKWNEIDLERGVWAVPANRMKAEKEHVVPISDRAQAILSEMEDVSDGGEFVFTGPRGGPLSNMAMLQLIKRMGRKGVTVHGFRSCFRDWAGDCTAYPREVAEGCLAHTIKGVEAAYRRSDALDKRRRLLQAWVTFCDTPGDKTGQVVSIQGNAQ